MFVCMYHSSKKVVLLFKSNIKNKVPSLTVNWEGLKLLSKPSQASQPYICSSSSVHVERRVGRNG